MEDGGLNARETGRRRGSGCIYLAIFALLVVAAIGAGFWFLGERIRTQFTAPSPETVAQASLQGLREQNRLSTFAARYVAVVTSKQSRLGLTAQKTMIMPGMVRYEVDLARLQPKDLTWNAASNTLTVELPPVEVVGPDVDLDHVREYGEGGILMALTDAESSLDAANRTAAQKELVRQANEPMPMRLARDATRRAIERSFALPLRATGLNATVEVFFPDERGSNRVQRMERSRSVDQVMSNKY